MTNVEGKLFLRKVKMPTFKQEPNVFFSSSVIKLQTIAERYNLMGDPHAARKVSFLASYPHDTGPEEIPILQ